MRTTCLILTKQPHRESDLLISGLSPDEGKMNFIEHGAGRIGKNHMPDVDLFRELEIEYTPAKSGDLHTLEEVSLLREFGALANNPRHFLFAGKMARFLVRNTRPGLGSPLVYDTMLNILQKLADNVPSWPMVRCAVVFKCVFMYENGVLPDTLKPSQSALLDALIEAGSQDGELPNLRDSYWTELNGWLDTLLRFNRFSKE